MITKQKQPNQLKQQKWNTVRLTARCVWLKHTVDKRIPTVSTQVKGDNT